MPAESNSALQMMVAALDKSLRVLPFKKRAAMRREDSLQFAGLNEFLVTYRELVRVSEAVFERLEADDPLRSEVGEALRCAHEAWGALLGGAPVTVSSSPLTDGSSQAGPHDAITLDRRSRSVSRSTALVPASTRQAVAIRVRRYPDEAALVRYVRHRRENHRWPDEAVITRYLRERRARGPRYPDEAVIARWLRERRGC
jgi:hypothetical protein